MLLPKVKSNVLQAFPKHRGVDYAPSPGFVDNRISIIWFKEGSGELPEHFSQSLFRVVPKRTYKSQGQLLKLEKKVRYEREGVLSVGLGLGLALGSLSVLSLSASLSYLTVIIRQGKAKQDKTTRQGRPDQTKTTRQDKTRQDKTRQDKTRQDKADEQKSREDKTRQGETKQNKAHNRSHSCKGTGNDTLFSVTLLSII